jgi:hypothetical protein
MLNQLDSLMDGGVSGNAVKIAQLKDAHPKPDEDRSVELTGSVATIVLNEEIKLSLKAQDSENELRGETGIAGIERGRAGEEFITGVLAGLDSLQNLKGDFAGR